MFHRKLQKSFLLVVVGMALLFASSGISAATGFDCSDSVRFQFCILFNAGSEIEDIAISPDDSKAAFIGNFTKVTILSLPDGEVLMTSFDHRDVGNALTFSPNGNSLAIGTNTGLSFWNINTGARDFVELESQVTAIAYSPNSDFIAFSTDAGDISLIDVASKEIFASVKDNNFTFARAVQSLAYSPDGDMLGSNSVDGTKLWSAVDLTLIHEFSDQQNAEIGEVDFSPDGRFFAHSIQTPEVPVRDITSESYHELWRFPILGAGARGASAAAFFPDNQRIAISSFEYDLNEPAVEIWDITTGESVRDLRGTGRTTVDVRIANDGSFVVGLSGSDGNNELHNVLIWRL